MSTPVLQAQGLSWRRPGAEVGFPPVFDGAGLCLEAGEIVSLMGPSGAGKTVLGTLLLRLRPAPQGASIFWEGEEVTRRSSFSLRRLRPRFQALLQHTGALLPPYLTVEQALVETQHHVLGEHDPAALAALSERLSITQLLLRRPRHLSGGEQRRVSLARVLLARPRFAFIDEAEAGLDPLSQREALDVLREAAARDGLSVLLVTHHEGTAIRYADRRLVLQGGALLAH